LWGYQGRPLMKFRPTDQELLGDIAALLEDQVMSAVGPELRHQVRVAANLARIMQRGAELEQAAIERERAALAQLLDQDGTLTELQAALDERIRCASEDDAAVWEVLVAIARDDLAIAKPGYDAWEGE
jgi:hypothetical protein